MKMNGIPDTMLNNLSFIWNEAVNDNKDMKLVDLVEVFWKDNEQLI
jgi:hypothetical protein